MSRLFFDSHFHALESTSEELSSEAFPSLSVSISAVDWPEQLDLRSSNTKIALGIHPWFVEQHTMQHLEQLEALLTSYPVDAIGEIGLDFFPDYRHTQPQQITFFEKQLLLAQQAKKPVSIHCRKAFDDVYNLLKQVPVNGFMHGFSGSYEQAQRFVRIGFKIGVGAAVLNPNAKKAQRLIEQLPVDEMVLETDFPFAKNNRGIYSQDVIKQIAAKIAEVKKMPINEVAEVTFNNAISILKD